MGDKTFAWFVCKKCGRRIRRPYPNEGAMIDKRNDCGGEMEFAGMYIPKLKGLVPGRPPEAT